jgi:pteridine reductase
MAAPETFSGDRPVAMVTGAARRVGLASATALAGAGCDLIITYRSSKDEAEEAARSLRSGGAAARTVRLDLNDLGGTQALGAGLARELPRLDVLVHNGSIYRPSPLDGLSADQLLENFRVHAAGPALLTGELAGLLRASEMPGGGAIVCMADIHAMGRPRRGYLAYAMSKSALVEMVRSLAVELAPRVRVNGVAPGAVEFAESGPDADPEMQERYLSRVPLGRSGTRDDAAEVVRWLAMDAHYTTGEIIRVDGGRWLR